MAASGFNAGGLSNWTLERVKINSNGSARLGRQRRPRRLELRRHGHARHRDRLERLRRAGVHGRTWACWAQTDRRLRRRFRHRRHRRPVADRRRLHPPQHLRRPRPALHGRRRWHQGDRCVACYSVANAGNQVKIKGNSLIENSVMVGHCTYFRGKHYMAAGDLCRAYGSTAAADPDRQRHRDRAPQHHRRRRRRADRLRRRHVRPTESTSRTTWWSASRTTPARVSQTLIDWRQRPGGEELLRQHGLERAYLPVGHHLLHGSEADQHDPGCVRRRAARRQPGGRQGPDDQRGDHRLRAGPASDGRRQDVGAYEYGAATTLRRRRRRLRLRSAPALLRR